MTTPLHLKLMTDFRAELQALVSAYDKHGGRWPQEDEVALLAAVERARAALAQPEPEGPTLDDIWELCEEHGFILADGTSEEESACVLWEIARAILARWGRPTPQPIPVSERLPGLIEQALIKAECALSDIAEGEAEESEGDPLEWAEKRAADALARIRPVMRQHQIQTSEWPPLPAHALPVPADD